MKWLRKWMTSSDALVLAWDRFGPDDIERLEHEIAEFGQHYQFAKLSEIARSLRQKAPLGKAGLVFLNARRGVVQFALPTLVKQGIPFTLFVRSDCVGLNRLPLEEEIAAYQNHYGPKMKECSDKLGSIWEDARSVDLWIAGLRSELGPLPLESLNPLDMFATWGSLAELPDPLFEMGIHVWQDPTLYLTEEAAFVSRQAKRPVSGLYCSKVLPKALLEQTPFCDYLLTQHAGTIQRETSPWALPCWNPKDSKV